MRIKFMSWIFLTSQFTDELDSHEKFTSLDRFPK